MNDICLYFEHVLFENHQILARGSVKTATSAFISIGSVKQVVRHRISLQFFYLDLSTLDNFSISIIYININMRIQSIDDDYTMNESIQMKNWSMLVNEMRFHLQIIDAAELLCDMMGLILFSMLVSSTLVIAFSLFVFELNESINLEVASAFIDVMGCLGLSFAHFYLSERITTDLLDIGDIFYNSPWYRLPKKRQKLVMMPIIRAGRVFRLTGFGLFDCSLEMFSAVMKAFFLFLF